MPALAQAMLRAHLHVSHGEGSLRDATYTCAPTHHAHESSQLGEQPVLSSIGWTLAPC